MGLWYPKWDPKNSGCLAGTGRMGAVRTPETQRNGFQKKCLASKLKAQQVYTEAPYVMITIEC